MVGIGTWVASVNTLVFKGDITLVISDNNGEYNIEFELPEKFKDKNIKIKYYDIKAEGNTVSGKGEVSLLPGKEIEAEVTFNGDEMTGVLKIPFIKRNIALKNGHRVK